MRIMKQLPILIALTLVGGMTIPAVAAPQLQAGNLLRNPGFSSGTDYWDTWSYQVEIFCTVCRRRFPLCRCRPCPMSPQTL